MSDIPNEKNDARLKAVRQEIEKILDTITKVRIDLDKALSIAWSYGIAETIYEELDEITDDFIEIGKALLIADENPEEAINRVRNLDRVAQKSVLNAWYQIAVEAQKECDKRTRMPKFVYADFAEPLNFKEMAIKSFELAVSKHENDDYGAIDDYKDCIDKYQKAVNRAKLTIKGARTKTIWQWVLTILAIAAIAISLLALFGVRLG